MWKSRVVCEISKGGGKGGKPVFGFPRFPRTCHFHGPPAAAIGMAVEPEIALCIAAAAALWRRSSVGHFGVAHRQGLSFERRQTTPGLRDCPALSIDFSFSNGVR